MWWKRPAGPPIGHFGLAVRDYMHSTAPNRRFPDLITARLIKAVLAKTHPPYDNAQLGELAHQCTTQEDAAQKVERRVRKSEAALVLESRIGEAFDGIVTGINDEAQLGAHLHAAGRRQAGRAPRPGSTSDRPCGCAWWWPTSSAASSTSCSRSLARPEARRLRRAAQRVRVDVRWRAPMPPATSRPASHIDSVAGSGTADTHRTV